jgi:hypothetical protein
MPQVGFEPRTPAFDRPKTVHTLDRWTAVIGRVYNISKLYKTPHALITYVGNIVCTIRV